MNFKLYSVTLAILVSFIALTAFGSVPGLVHVVMAAPPMQAPPFDSR